MANVKISDLTALAAADLSDDDLLVITDVSEALAADQSKKITIDNLAGVQTYTPTWTAATTNPTIGNGSLEGWFVKFGHIAIVQLYLVIGSTTTLGSGNWQFSLPTAAAPNALCATTTLGLAHMLEVGSGRHFGQAVYGGASYFTISLGGASWVNASYPMSWGAGDWLRASLSYISD
jgi:hypothetical protein